MYFHYTYCLMIILVLTMIILIVEVHFPMKLLLTFQDREQNIDLNLKASCCGLVLLFQLFIFCVSVGQTRSIKKKEQQNSLCTETGILNKTLQFLGNQINCLKNQIFRLAKLYETLEKMSENIL